MNYPQVRHFFGIAIRNYLSLGSWHFTKQLCMYPVNSGDSPKMKTKKSQATKSPWLLSPCSFRPKQNSPIIRQYMLKIQKPNSIATFYLFFPLFAQSDTHVILGNRSPCRGIGSGWQLHILHCGRRLSHRCSMLPTYPCCR